jgi:hypothetical protein
VYFFPHIRHLALQLGLLAAVPVLAWPQGTSACDFVAPYGTVDVADVQAIINMTLGISPCTVNIGGQGVCNAAVVQRVINAALGGTCLTGFGAVAHYATLNWAASTSTGISGYNIYRATTPTATLVNGLYTKLNSSPIVGTTYVDTTVSAGVIYYYATTAVSNTCVESTASNQFQAPAIPTP